MSAEFFFFKKRNLNEDNEFKYEKEILGFKGLQLLSYYINNSFEGDRKNVLDESFSFSRKDVKKIIKSIKFKRVFMITTYNEIKLVKKVFVDGEPVEDEFRFNTYIKTKKLLKKWLRNFFNRKCYYFISY